MKRYRRICLKFSGNVRLYPTWRRLDFGGDPYQAFGSRKGLKTIVRWGKPPPNIVLPSNEQNGKNNIPFCEVCALRVLYLVEIYLVHNVEQTTYSNENAKISGRKARKECKAPK